MDTLRGNISNTLKYEGYVDVVVRDGNLVRKTISDHNSGTIDLCNYIRDALLCEETTTNAPRSIIACRKINDYTLENLFNIGYPHSSKSKGEPIIDEVTKKPLGATAVFKFIIPWTYLSEGTQIGGFRLMNSNSALSDGSVMAEIFLDNPIDLRSNTNLEVTWTLVIKYV